MLEAFLFRVGSSSSTLKFMSEWSIVNSCKTKDQTVRQDSRMNRVYRQGGSEYKDVQGLDMGEQMWICVGKVVASRCK